MATALMWDSRFMWHDAGPGAHVLPAGGLVQPDRAADAPERVHRIYALADAIGLTDQLDVVRPRKATEEELQRFHPPSYLARIREMSAIGAGDSGELAPVTADTYEVARLAAGACMHAVELVLDGAVDNAYALVRPAGHHAEAELGRGSCVFANEVLAALHARATRGVERIAIVDWDAHHGNSAQRAFWDDPGVLTISIHQDGWFPFNSGAVEEIGGPNARGLNVNVPLPPGSGEGAFFDALDRVVVPALREFRPELIIIGSGYDAAVMEPNASMLLNGGSFSRLTRTLMDAAEELCEGRLIATHLGGFNLGQVPFTAIAVIQTLAGAPVTEDPYRAVGGDSPWQGLQPHQRAAIDRAVELRSAATTDAIRSAHPDL